MRKFLTAALLALAFLVSPALPLLGAAQAAGTIPPNHGTRVVTLLASAARTATATGSWVSTNVATYPTINLSAGLSRHMHVFLNVTAAAAGTLDLTIEGSMDGGTTAFVLTAASAWTQVTTSTGKQVRRYEGPITPLIRAVGTAASTPNHTYSVIALLGG